MTGYDVTIRAEMVCGDTFKNSKDCLLDCLLVCLLDSLNMGFAGLLECLHMGCVEMGLCGQVSKFYLTIKINDLQVSLL